VTITAPERRPLYLDACATTPPAVPVLEAMAAAAATAWANPSSLHGFGLAAAELLERSRLSMAASLGCDPEALVFTSGGTESIHAALLGAAVPMASGRLLISAVEHPATVAAAAALERRGWQVEVLPVDGLGRIELAALESLLDPPTRLVSVIWGQSEVGTVQPIEAIGRRCRQAGVPLHVDAVQVVGHRSVAFNRLPLDLLSCAAHKLQGPRGVGALLVRPDLPFVPLIGGGGQEGGRRGGTEAVALVAGFARALELCDARLAAHGGTDPVAALRDGLLRRLLDLPGVRLSGPDPLGGEFGICDQRLPHHISLLISDTAGAPLSGRRLVQMLWRHGVAVSSGSACSSAAGPAPSPVLQAMGLKEAEAASGLRLSLGPWLQAVDLEGVPDALVRSCAALAADEGRPRGR
jgi:cysteine desulfurase